MNHDTYDDSYIRGILNTVKTIAMVGASAKDNRPSYFAFKYLLERGYDMIPINPGLAGKQLLGKTIYARLSEVPEPIDMIDIFRAANYAVPVVQEALTLKVKPRVIWMQLSVRNDEAAALAEANGMKVVMNRCPKIEYGRLSSEIGWMGINSRTLSSKRAKLLGGGVQRMSLNRTTLAGGSTDATDRAARRATAELARPAAREIGSRTRSRTNRPPRRPNGGRLAARDAGTSAALTPPPLTLSPHVLFRKTASHFCGTCSKPEPRQTERNPMTERTPGFNTLAIHAGAQPDPTTGARATPIYQTTSFVFDDVDHAASLFGLQAFGNIYTRIGNPTNAVLEERVAALEGGTAGLAVASGHAAQVLVMQALMMPGEEFVASKKLYGGSINQFNHAFKSFGWNVVWADPDDISTFERAVTPKTKAIFIESIANPGGVITDIEAVSNIARKARVPLIVDNTLATPYLCKPIEHGADIVVHSLTKFLGGHGNSIGGMIVDGGTFNWSREGRYPMLSDPRPGI